MQTAIFVNLWQPRSLDRIFSFEVVRMENPYLTVIGMDYSVFNSQSKRLKCKSLITFFKRRFCCDFDNEIKKGLETC